MPRVPEPPRRRIIGERRNQLTLASLKLLTWRCGASRGVVRDARQADSLKCANEIYFMSKACREREAWGPVMDWYLERFRG